MGGAKLAWTWLLWQGPRAKRRGSNLASTGPECRSLRRRSSVVEHVIGNDGVSSSILLGGTSIFNGFMDFGFGGKWPS